jgi:hypothetical protein
MQKQRRGVSQKRILKNQNSALDASTSSFLYSLCDNIEGSDYKTEYLKSSYLSKYADPDPALSKLRYERAVQKWLDSETHNALSNERLRNRDAGYNILPRVTWRSFLKHCRRTIANTLGELTDGITVGSFSGGASTSRRRTESHPGFKFNDKADVTPDAIVVCDVLNRQIPLFRKHGLFTSLREVRGAALFTVPKNSDIDRCACKEPDINMYLQKGVGSHIRKRLRFHGIDLNDQSINRAFARKGSIDGSLATIDLSSASDTICIETVRLLLPPVWFEYLNSIRSQEVLVNGEYVTTEMFSSMGNGFTFELESLLFFSIVKSVLYFEGIPGHLSVYGDDIICPSQGYELVSFVLESFGFLVNHKKSYATGFFRESCGGHYYKGEDVTPFYLKRPCRTLTDLIRLTNQLRKWALCPSTGLLVGDCDPSVKSLWIRLIQLVPEDLRGGYDLELDTIAVSLHTPRNRLVRITSRKQVPAVGLYFQWHNSVWNRTQEPKAPVRDVIDSNSFCRRRPASHGGQTSRILFLEEVLDPSCFLV